MSTALTITKLLPDVKKTTISAKEKTLSEYTFIGIDFGTSTTVVTRAYTHGDLSTLKTETLWLSQLQDDGAIAKGEKVPSVIAWQSNKILVGSGAAQLKYKLKKDVNVWHSFKMELGEDLGLKYFNSELNTDKPFRIQSPLDATKVFFNYLNSQILKIVKENNWPSEIRYAVSIPASFEANQRKDLIEALKSNNIALNNQALIDEPNAAFLSYIEYSNTINKPLFIPDDYNLNVLVFDFGAGTCDISILEISKGLNGISSKNLAISRFEKLGGNDIDRLIAYEILLPQLLAENNLSQSDFRPSEITKGFIPNLLSAAEILKIAICSKIPIQKLNNSVLPVKSGEQQMVSIDAPIIIYSRRGKLTLANPKMSFKQFESIMQSFLSAKNTRKKIMNVSDDFISIFNPIASALQKASLKTDEIDYVLLIGGSAKNPYVQSALKKHFTASELLIPADLQTHVSNGAAIHSLVFNGLNKNIINPITSESLLLITKDVMPRILVPAGTHIPCQEIIIDNLTVSAPSQKAIELPVSVGSIDKILFNIKIFPDNADGFAKETVVKLCIQITADKLLQLKAYAENREVLVEPLNPFANKELTTDERNIFQMIKKVNNEAATNAGKPKYDSLYNLAKTYEKVENYNQAADTLALLEELYPLHFFEFNYLGVLYSNAGHTDKAHEYFKKDFERSPGKVAALNIAITLKQSDLNTAEEYLKKSLSFDAYYPHALYELALIYHNKGNLQESKELATRAFQIWKNKFETNQLGKNDYSWFASCASLLGDNSFAEHIRNSAPKNDSNVAYNFENLTITKVNAELIKP